MADKKRDFDFLVDYYPEKADQMYPPLACLEFVLRPFLIYRESSPAGKKYQEYEEEASQTHSVAQEYIDFLFYSDKFKSLNYISRGKFCVEFSIILDRIKNGFRNGKRNSLSVDIDTFFVWIIRAMASIAMLTPHCFPEINFNKKELRTTTWSFPNHKGLFTENEPFHSKISPLDHDYVDYLKNRMDWFDNVNKIRRDVVHFLNGKIFPYPTTEYETILEEKYKSSDAILSEIKEYSKSLFSFLYFFDRHFFEKIKNREELKNSTELSLAMLRIHFRDVRYEDLIYNINPVHVRVKKVLKEILFA